MNAYPAPAQVLRPTPDVPAWVFEGLDGGPDRWVEDEDGLEERCLSGRGRVLVSVRRRGALNLSADEFRAASYRAYTRIARRVVEHEAADPIRIWNFIPAILRPLGKLPHRYMVFNAGRFQAYERWLGHAGRFHQQVATATGVGHYGGDLVIHCLTAERPGSPVENPRQVASYRYSERYGPLPPCFARATRIEEGGACQLLVGGTASVLGEDSVHQHSLDHQAAETFSNLAAVVRAGRVHAGQVHAGQVHAGQVHAGQVHAGQGGECPGETMTRADEDRELACYRSLRIYHVRDDDVPRLNELLRERFPSSTELEMVQADLCRPELLVEIEGVADLEGGGPRGLANKDG